ncbi:uncharacterized protein LOC129614524 [Condylostylus longicornis]|uniref:uncharacterized protein LOC129614524 n=1 Tax=Condylostylus longicornis TaxID=2530218 RepID=UPI00244DB127|nr:uncharacterized protein LOC129614524 [Condylostylus longicornis]
MNQLRAYFISIFCILLVNIAFATTPTEEHNLHLRDSRIINLDIRPVNTLKKRHANPLSGGNQMKKMNREKKSNSKKPNNKELLERLGLSEVIVPISHGRKRLAVESRRFSRPDDSKMFIVKLPPQPAYYGNVKFAHPKNSVNNNDVQKLNFRSNGKLGRIYHWNLPVINKVAQKTDKKLPQSNIKSSRKNDKSLIDIKNIPTWSNQWENETIDKYGSYDTVRSIGKKASKKSIPSYYAPHNYIKGPNSNFHKNFPSNGKPKGLYVMGKTGKKPLYYKNITS